MKKFYDRKRNDSCEYSIGDKVWLEGMNITTTRPSKKLGDKRYGPFVIEKKEGKSTYRLTLPPTWKKIHPVFNKSLLTPYKEPEFPSQQQPDKPPPIIVNNMALSLSKRKKENPLIALLSPQLGKRSILCSMNPFSPHTHNPNSLLNNNPINHHQSL